jgi:alkylation response protein AidB-like acyl-CoA dehydrogenase
MDATFTEEQELLAEVAGSIAERFATKGTPDEAWQALAAAGLIGLRLPLDVGGGGASGVEVAITCEALGRSVTPVPYIGPLLAGELLRAAGAPHELLVAVASGERRVTVVLDRSLGRLARWKRDVDPIGWDAAGADTFVGIDSSGPDHRVAMGSGPATPRTSGDLTRQLVELTGGSGFEPVGGTVADPELMRWEALAQVALCADMVGAMRGALDLAVSYVSERIQFGRPIGSFQAIQHLAADQHVSIEASQSATYYAAWAVDGLDPKAALSAALTAKTYVSRRGREVTENVLQMHGGMGHTWEYRAHYFLRRVLLDRVTLGDESVQLARLADDVAPGWSGSPSMP